MRYWMLPVPIRYRMTVLDDGIGRYRYRMTVFSRNRLPQNGDRRMDSISDFLAFSLSLSRSGILSLSLSHGLTCGLRPAFLLPLPCSHFPASNLGFALTVSPAATGEAEESFTRYGVNDQLLDQRGSKIEK